MTAEDWGTRPLGELFDIGAGKTMSAAARSGSNQVPFLRTSNVFWDRLDLSSLDYMALDEFELAERDLRQGDLLVCEGGAIGRAALWDGSIERITFQNHLHRLRPRAEVADQVDPRFYVFFLQSAFTQLGLFEGAGNRTTIPNLSKNRLAALDVPFPDKAEQSAVAQALGLVREAVGVQSAALEAAEALRRSVSNDLFSRGLRGESRQDSILGAIPASWNVVGFATIRQSLRYGTSVRCVSERVGRPVLRIPNVRSARIDTSDLKYADLRGEEAARYTLADGDLLFIRTNGGIDRLGMCAVYRGVPADALFASYLISARLKDGYDPDFVAHFLASDIGTDLIASRATPAADGKYNLNTAIIDSIPIPVPLLEEQRQIAATIRSVEDKIALHRTKLARLEELFDRLLLDLMTGAISVQDLALASASISEG